MRLWLKTFLTLALVALAGYVLDRLLRYEGMPRRDLLVLSDVLVGLVAATLVFIIGRHQQLRDKFVAARLSVIADMNHHIRNALQVITFHAVSAKDGREIGAMQDAVKRITWALSEILPQMPDFQGKRDELSKAAAADAALRHAEELGTASGRPPWKG